MEINKNVLKCENGHWPRQKELEKHHLLVKTAPAISTCTTFSLGFNEMHDS